MSELKEYKCPNCGGAMNFDSSLQKLKCHFCDGEFEVEDIDDLEDVSSKSGKDKLDWDTSANSSWQEGEADHLSVYICESCGGEIVGDENMAATKCPYCDNPVIIKDKLSNDLRPDCVIPFKLDKKAAKENFYKHLSDKKLLPKVFKDRNHIDEIKGLYVPFWLFDAKADASLDYLATKIRSWSDNRYIYTEKRNYRVIRKGSIGFERVPVDGSSKMPDDLMESIEPFDISEAVDFNTAYLAGYLADKYDVDSNSSVMRANERIKVSTDHSFKQTVVNYNTVVSNGSCIDLSQSSIKYALYPVWILNTTWNNKKYIFAMNGQTGKFVGNLPVDKGAFWKWFFLCMGISATVFTGLSFLLGLL